MGIYKFQLWRYSGDILETLDLQPPWHERLWPLLSRSTQNPRKIQRSLTMRKGSQQKIKRTVNCKNWGWGLKSGWCVHMLFNPGDFTYSVLGRSFPPSMSKTVYLPHVFILHRWSDEKLRKVIMMPCHHTICLGVSCFIVPFIVVRLTHQSWFSKGTTLEITWITMIKPNWLWKVRMMFCLTIIKTTHSHPL